MEHKFLTGMYHVLNYYHALFECNPSIHSQICYYIVAVALAVASSVDAHHTKHFYLNASMSI